jgi:flagellar protein FlbD
VIKLTRLNNSRLAVNCDLIKYVEEAPDTVLTLLNGEKLVVRETADQVIAQMREYRRSVLISGEEGAIGSESADRLTQGRIALAAKIERPPSG